ncbi:MAG: prolipoprotein diacylglyceryl transferase [Clostridiales bacterium]|nr:MAG: prolipoprotein diacylglyceryl transferase [Clostridiales bacterium]
MGETVKQIGFEGLGIKPFNVNNVAFTIGDNFAVYWYAIIITLGMILAVIFAMKFANKVGVTADDIVDCALWGTPFALIGARLYYIIFSLDEFIGNSFTETIKNMVDIRTGGLAIYGGIIFGFLTALIVCKIKKIKALAIFDVAALGFLIGQAVGRWGNFVNGEAYGELCNLPWGMTINGAGPYHPTFLYESLWNILGFVLLLLFTLKLRKHRGETFFGYMIWYGIGRALIEGLRTDSLWLIPESLKKAWGLNFNLRVSQVLSIIIAVAGVVLFIVARRGIFDRIAEKNAQKREMKRALKSNNEEAETYIPVFLQENDESDELEELDKIEDELPEEVNGDVTEDNVVITESQMEENDDVSDN